jgi:hypothetical protein
MKTATTVLAALLLGAWVTAAAQTPPQQAAVHRYVIERTFPAGALEGLDAAVKAKVNANHSRFGVRWVMSYANAAKTKTYCVYEGPDEAAICEAVAANTRPVDPITEVPVTLLPR